MIPRSSLALASSALLSLLLANSPEAIANQNANPDSQVKRGKLASNAISIDRALHPGIADGPGIWMNLWSYPQGDVDEYCKKLQRHGVRNLFIQTSRSNTPALQQVELLGKLIESCHRHGVHVIAWSFAELANPEADAEKMVVAARFKTPRGQCFDAVAPNLEKDLSYAKVERYTKYLRKELGEKYPLIAVVFSPLNKSPQVANTPWKLLDKHYDVIAPMAYWNSKYAKLEPYSYTRDTVDKIRELVGRADVEIHVIGDGMKTFSPAIKECFAASRDSAVSSVSIYPFHYVTDDQYNCLATYFEFMPRNSRYKQAAFSKLYSAGAFSSKCKSPADQVERGEFYSLLASRLLGEKVADSKRSFELLSAFGIIDASIVPPGSVDHFLHRPANEKEAYALTARLIEAQARAREKGLRLDSARPVKLVSPAGRKEHAEWFVLPARASSLPGDKEKGLTYMEAAQLLLGVGASTSGS